MQVVVKLLLIAAVFSGAAMSQPPEPLENRLLEQVYLAKDDGLGAPGEKRSEFVTTDIPIHCVVVLSNVESATVRMDLVAVGVAGVKPGTKVVSASYTTSDFQDQVYFTGKPRGLWVRGEYRADIFINGTLVDKRAFRVMPASAPAGAVIRTDPKQSGRTSSAGVVRKVKPYEE